MEEKSVLRWGGLAGMLGGIFLILAFVTRFAFVGVDPEDPEGLVRRFPDVAVALAVEDSLYLAALVLWVPLFLALYRALQGTTPAPALFGTALGTLGLVVLAAGALPHVAFAPISDVYHAPGATPEEQATALLLSQTTQGIFGALLVVGLLLVPIGLVVLAVAMLRAPAFGKGFGGATVVLGGVGVVTASIQLVAVSPIAAIGVLALIVLLLVLGWKVLRLSKAA